MYIYIYIYLFVLAHRNMISGCTLLSVLSLLLHTYLLTYSVVLLEKLQLVKKFPAFHGTRRFITALTSFRHLSLSWASPIQSTYPNRTSWRSILISTHLRLGLPVVSFPPFSPPKPYTPFSSPVYAACLSNLIGVTL